MFHFPGFPPRSLTTSQSNTPSVCGCPIRISSDQCPLAAPRGVSPPAASFIGSSRLGIHHVPFLPYPINLRFPLTAPVTPHSTTRTTRTTHTSRESAESLLKEENLASLAILQLAFFKLYIFNFQRTSKHHGSSSENHDNP